MSAQPPQQSAESAPAAEGTQAIVGGPVKTATSTTTKMGRVLLWTLTAPGLGLNPNEPAAQALKGILTATVALVLASMLFFVFGLGQKGPNSFLHMAIAIAVCAVCAYPGFSIATTLRLAGAGLLAIAVTTTAVGLNPEVGLMVSFMPLMLGVITNGARLALLYMLAMMAAVAFRLLTAGDEWIAQQFSLLAYVVSYTFVTVLMCAALLLKGWSSERLGKAQGQAASQRQAAVADGLSAEQPPSTASLIQNFDWLGAIAHELRTPAAGLVMLLREPNLEFNRRELESLAQHNLDIIDDMRLIISPDDEVVVNRDPFSLIDLSHDLQRHVAPLFTSGRFDLRIFQQFEPGTAAVLGDAYRLRTIVSNLIRNAVHHSGGSEIAVYLRSTASAEGAIRLSVSVSDNGKGLDPAQLEYLTQPTTRGPTDAPGSGLGLYIIRSWLDFMNATLTLDRSQSHGGAEFTFELTLASAAAEKALEPVRREDLLRGKRVLLAEDDAIIGRLTAGQLTGLGAKVTRATDGIDALQMMLQQPFDVLITDYLMPLSDGAELTASARSAGFQGPIIAVTAATLGDEANTLYAAGADAVLSKPLRAEQLEEALVNLPPLRFSAMNSADLGAH